jgi:drug/metabolite transporter (DMT)-like permease
MWVLFAVLNPISDATRNIFSKRASINADPLIISWFNNLIPLILFLPGIFFVDLIFNYHFFEAVFVSGTINIAAVILYHRSISKGDISVVVPILSFTPLFLLIWSPIIVGEFPGINGIAGIVLIVFGSYLLNLDLKKREFLAPIKAIFVNKGTRYMLIVAVILSISANFDKLGIESASILQYIIFVNLYISAGITIILLLKKKFSVPQIKREYKNLLLVGFLTTLAFIFHMKALSLTLVAYVISIKRTSGMISVFLGYFFLNEKNLRDRLLGAAVMFLGVLLILLF